MSTCAALVYIQEHGLCFGFVTFHLPPLRSGGAVKSEQGGLLLMRGSPTLYLLFDLLYLYY